MDDFALEEVTLPPPVGGQLLLETLWISIDPAMRGWLDDRPSYLPPVKLGEPVRALGLARVLESSLPGFEPGQVVRGFVGWQQHVLSGDPSAWEVIDESPSVPLPTRLGVLGMTGMTAWVGIKEIADVRAGDTVVVSAAAGAVGSVAVQLAKAAGARVVGIAGGPEKCGLLLNSLGVDAVVDHRADNWQEQLSEATPDGVDVNFENVGGPVLEAVIARLNDHARVVLCGLINGYNLEQRPPGPSNFGLLLTKRVKLQGFIVFDHADKTAEIEKELTTLLQRNQIKPFDTIVHGFDSLPEVFVRSFDSAHVGKLIVGVT
ncbi:NADPH-dependent curcumin reductase CurA [Rhodococcus erythropolis]|nr:NADPH-dependent curcumin reductase CurA [Rhodococcus erythropolis]MCW2425209.1 NADPH-dependent curcumin reductase CurA [Rhodococcus erythropolis]